MAKTEMTNEELMKKLLDDADCCPWCGLSDPSQGETEVEPGRSATAFECFGCGAEFRKIHTLSGAEVVKGPDPEDET